MSFAVEWFDAKERLLKIYYAGQIEAIGRAQALVEFTPDGTIIEANNNFLNVMGYTMEDIRGRSHTMFVEPGYRNSPDYAEFWGKIRQGHCQLVEVKRIGNGGKEVWIQGSYNPILDSHGKVIRVIKFAIDITKRVRDVKEIAASLKALSRGNLEHRVREPLLPELDQLRLDLNSALDNLQEAMRQVKHSAGAVHGGTQEIRSSSDNLARRTEQQAANLEETAAALDEITATVKRTAEGASHARGLVTQAKATAERSGEVVSRAVSAMNGIETSAQQISRIIGVIDEIAFQTNLLALNAGVEAARAGEAGRGFAVVASEVRALAQRSAEAAKEIKTLISTSSEQVNQGVTMVGQAGTALQAIVTQVSAITTIVLEIAASAEEQSNGLHEVRGGLANLDSQLSGKPA